MQVGQTVERDTRIPVMLDVIADIARQDENRLKQSRNRGASDTVFFFLAFHCAVLANNPRVLYCNVPRAIRNDPVKQEGVPSAKDGERSRKEQVESNSRRDHPMR